MTNIIGDIAGRYKELVLLLQKMPAGEVISVGDMVDRGPDSKKVIEFFIKNNYRAVMGNHEHMMVDYLTQGQFYSHGIWLRNGGNKTLDSYGPSVIVPPEHLTWLINLPKYLEVDKTLISHAFLDRYEDDDLIALEDGCDLGNCFSRMDKLDVSLFWNRGDPRRRSSWDLQVAGHNGRYKQYVDDKGLYAVCIDDSRNNKLTGLHLESGMIYQQDYLY